LKRFRWDVPTRQPGRADTHRRTSRAITSAKTLAPDGCAPRADRRELRLKEAYNPLEAISSGSLVEAVAAVRAALEAHEVGGARRRRQLRDHRIRRGHKLRELVRGRGYLAVLEREGEDDPRRASVLEALSSRIGHDVVRTTTRKRC
jgi:hypothetical protein